MRIRWRRRTGLLWGMALLLLFWSLLTPAVSRAGLQERVSEEVLANGLKVILLE
ncbi:MAG: hypothetical protein JRH07_16410, partial [Deltaproteobacteria bacterium]|nr:hypothetical protein [Deltaproteobacteria bacterium]